MNLNEIATLLSAGAAFLLAFITLILTLETRRSRIHQTRPRIVIVGDDTIWNIGLKRPNSTDLFWCSANENEIKLVEDGYSPWLHAKNVGNSPATDVTLTFILKTTHDVLTLCDNNLIPQNFNSDEFFLNYIPLNGFKSTTYFISAIEKFSLPVVSATPQSPDTTKILLPTKFQWNLTLELFFGKSKMESKIPETTFPVNIEYKDIYGRKYFDQYMVNICAFMVRGPAQEAHNDQLGSIIYAKIYVSPDEHFSIFEKIKSYFH